MWYIEVPFTWCLNGDWMLESKALLKTFPVLDEKVHSNSEILQSQRIITEKWDVGKCCVMREAVLKATCDKGVHQKRLNADSPCGVKEQRKFNGPHLSAIITQSYNA